MNHNFTMKKYVQEMILLIQRYVSAMFAFLNIKLLKVRLSFLSRYYEKYNNYLEIVCFYFDF